MNGPFGNSGGQTGLNNPAPLGQSPIGGGQGPIGGQVPMNGGPGSIGNGQVPFGAPGPVASGQPGFNNAPLTPAGNPIMNPTGSMSAPAFPATTFPPATSNNRLNGDTSIVGRLDVAGQTSPTELPRGNRVMLPADHSCAIAGAGNQVSSVLNLPSKPMPLPSHPEAVSSAEPLPTNASMPFGGPTPGSSQSGPFGSGQPVSHNRPILKTIPTGQCLEPSSPSAQSSSSSSPSRSSSSSSASSSSASGKGSTKQRSTASSKRSVASIALLVVGAAFLASVLVFIIVDQLSTPKVELPAQMPVAPEVTEWNRSVHDYVPSADHPTAVDPVSKEPVDPHKTPYKIDVYGTWFYFKTEANLKAFVDDPLKYLKINVNVKLLDNDPAEVPSVNSESDKHSGEATNGENALSPDITKGSDTATDNASLYQQVPAPQGDNSASVDSSVATEPSLAAPPDPGFSAPGEPIQDTATDNASLYQQVPAPQGDQSMGQEQAPGGMHGGMPSEGMGGGIVPEQPMSSGPGGPPEEAGTPGAQDNIYNGIPGYVPGQ